MIKIAVTATIDQRIGAVARLEWAHIEVYDAAITPTPTLEFVASITDTTVFHLQPSVYLLDLAYPVDELLIAVRQSAGSSDTSPITQLQLAR